MSETPTNLPASKTLTGYVRLIQATYSAAAQRDIARVVAEAHREAGLTPDWVYDMTNHCWKRKDG